LGLADNLALLFDMVSILHRTRLNCTQYTEATYK
jgi:hypothetical protein